MHKGDESSRRAAISRRSFLAFGAGAGAAALTLVPDPVQAAVRLMPERSLTLYNIHTGEHLKATYWAHGRYQADQLHQVNHLLRDHRSGHAHTMDPKVLDLIAAVQRKCGAKGPVHIISGYRSPETNAWLHSASDGVACNSLHMQGKAVDIRLPGHSTGAVGRAARSLRAGGVGIYPASDFVHVDTGRVRYW
jgi:uncharacterized protein YcbK (DUF882 family)